VLIDAAPCALTAFHALCHPRLGSEHASTILPLQVPALSFSLPIMNDQAPL
jgi:hypothetical protein